MEIAETIRSSAVRAITSVRRGVTTRFGAEHHLSVTDIVFGDTNDTLFGEKRQRYSLWRGPILTSLYGGSGDDKLYGGYGDPPVMPGIPPIISLAERVNDTLAGGMVMTAYDGGEGNDIAYGDAGKTDFTPTLARIPYGGDGDDTFCGIEEETTEPTITSMGAMIVIH